MGRQNVALGQRKAAPSQMGRAPGEAQHTSTTQLPALPALQQLCGRSCQRQHTACQCVGLAFPKAVLHHVHHTHLRVTAAPT